MNISDMVRCHLKDGGLVGECDDPEAKTIREIAAEIGISERCGQAKLKALIHAGLAEHCGYRLVRNASGTLCRVPVYRVIKKNGANGTAIGANKPSCGKSKRGT